MKVFVTGAGGYIGRYVVKHLLLLGHDVTTAQRKPGLAIEGSTALNIDILQAGTDIFDAVGRPDICIHMAWEQGFLHGSPLHIKNVEKHIAFMQNMLSGGLKHLVGIGAMHEIGYHVGPVTESTPTNPVNAYGIAKNYLQRVQSLLCNQ